MTFFAPVLEAEKRDATFAGLPKEDKELLTSLFHRLNAIEHSTASVREHLMATLPVYLHDTILIHAGTTVGELHSYCAHEYP